MRPCFGGRSGTILCYDMGWEGGTGKPYDQGEKME